MQTHHKIEDFGSKGLLRILGTIYQHGPMNIGSICRRTGMNHANVDIHLSKLKEYGLVEEKRYETMRMIRPSMQRVALHFERGNRFSIDLQ